MGDIKFVKFKNGEELVAAIELKDDKVKLTDAIKIVPTPEGIVQMAAFPLCAEPTVEMSSDLIAFTSDLDTTILNHYKQQFGGIVEMPKNIVLP